MNLTLFRTDLKSNWILLLIFVAVMVMYLAIIISMYDPASTQALNDMLRALPDALVNAMMFKQFGPGLTSFMAGYFYGFLVLLFPMIYCIILGNGLVARHVDTGSMAYLLSTPVSRITLVMTQATYFLTSLVVLFGVMVLVGLGISAAMFPGQLEVRAFVLFNVSALLLFWAVSGICFFFSCLFNETRYSVGFGAGIPLLFLVLKMLSEVGARTKWLGNLSLYSLYDVSRIMAGGSFVYVTWVVYIALAVVLYGAGIVVFNRKDLPI